MTAAGFVSHAKRAGVVLAVVISCVALAADEERTKASESAGAVMDRYGSSDKLNSEVMEPLSTGTPMTTVDGEQSFTAQVSCPKSEQFLRVGIVPTSANDIQSIAVQLDSNFDGTVDYTDVQGGPIAAICVNGFHRCPAGSTQPCTYHRWAAIGAGTGITAVEVGQEDLGSCYCFNNSCGNGLLIRNSHKIVNDIGVGMIAALQAAQPRIQASESTAPDEFSAVFYGQNAGCNAASLPEQYRNNPSGLVAAGQAANDDPNFEYAFLRDSAAANQSGYAARQCVIQRTATTEQVWRDAVTVLSQNTSQAGLSAGTVTSCGAGCMQVLMNQRGNNYYRNLGSCGYRTFQTTFRVDRPDLVESVTLTEVGRDDWLRISVNSSVIYNDKASWTGVGSTCGENGSRGTRALNVDATGFFTSATAGGTVNVLNELSVDDDGEGWSVWTIRWRQTCEATTEQINDTCQANETDPSCELWEETVDGVNTVHNYYSTGLTPLPSTKTYGEQACQVQLYREWHSKQRTYMCRQETSPYDGEDARRRYDTIHGSFDPASGAFTDATKDENGTWSTSQSGIPLPPSDPNPGCTPTCKVRRERPGANVGMQGSTTQLNATGVAWDYTYRACDRDPNVCPAQAGEDIVSGCDCRTTFGEAAALIQTIRMTGQDMICTQDE